MTKIFLSGEQHGFCPPCSAAEVLNDCATDAGISMNKARFSASFSLKHMEFDHGVIGTIPAAIAVAMLPF